MSASLTNKVALVTGASRGIGQAIAEELASNGAKVVVNYVHNKRFAEETIHRIEQNGGQALAVQADVSKIADLETLFRATMEQLGRLDILVNNTELFTTGKSAAQIEMITRMIAFGRLGEPEDISKAVLFLASDDAAWVTGQTLRVNGGFI